MKSRAMKVMVIWNIALTMLFLASFLFNAALVQAAADPPVHIYTSSPMSNGGDYNQTTGPTTVNSNSYVKLASVSVKLSTTSTCLVMASADVNAAGHGSTHNVGLNIDTTSSDLIASDREVYFSGADDREVSTVYGFTNLSGSHTFYFLAVGTPSMSVKSRSMVVACFTTRL